MRFWLSLQLQRILSPHCSDRMGCSEICTAIGTSVPIICIPMQPTGQTPSRAQRVRYHATPSILGTNGKPCTHHGNQLPQWACNIERKTPLWHLELLPASSSSRLLPCTHLSGYKKQPPITQYVVLMTDQYSKLKQAVPTLRTSAVYAMFIFYDHCSFYLVTHLPSNRKQHTIREQNGLKHLKTSAYHPDKFSGCTIQKNSGGLATPLGAWAPARVGHFCAGTHIAYNDQINCLSASAQFTLVISRHPPGLRTFNRLSALPTQAKHNTAPFMLNARMLHNFAVMEEKSDKKLTTAHRWYKDHHHCCICAIACFKPGVGFYAGRPTLAVTATSCRQLTPTWNCYLKRWIHTTSPQPKTRHWLL